MLIAIALAIAQGKKTPWDEDTASESDCSTDDEDLSGLQGDTEFKQLYSSVKTAVTSLMRISVAIRAPAPHNQMSRAIAMGMDKTYYEPYDILHVQAKFGTAPKFLVDRLGRATAYRRQYIAYREMHCLKLSRGIEELGNEESRTEHTTNSTEATPVPIIGRVNSLKLGEDEVDVRSETSYALSVKDAIRTPRLPKEAAKAIPYECPYCFALIEVYDKSEWK